MITVIPILIGALGTAKKATGGRVETIKTTALLR